VYTRAMRTFAILVAVTASSSAFAQSADPGTAEPPGTNLPPPPPPPMVLPAAVRPHPIEMTGDGFQFHHGVTFEASLGVFYAHRSDDQFGDVYDDRIGVSSGVGVGLFVTPRVALTLRAAGGDFVDVGNVSATTFLGPSAQVWLDPHIWVGAGIGLAGLLQLSGCDSSTTQCQLTGLGFDARLGYSVGGTAHTINVSLEATPAYYGTGTTCGLNQPSSSFGLALMLGYQYL
jgi:hypothetical protein